MSVRKRIINSLSLSYIIYYQKKGRRLDHAKISDTMKIDYLFSAVPFLFRASRLQSNQVFSFPFRTTPKSLLSESNPCPCAITAYSFSFYRYSRRSWECVELSVSSRNAHPRVASILPISSFCTVLTPLRRSLLLSPICATDDERILSTYQNQTELKVDSPVVAAQENPWRGHSFHLCRIY